MSATTPDVVVGAGLAAAAAGTWFGVHLGDLLAARTVRRAAEQESDDLAVARAVGVYVPTDGGRSSGQSAAAIAWHAQPRAEVHEHGVPFDLAGCDQCWAEFQELQARAGDR